MASTFRPIDEDDRAAVGGHAAAHGHRTSRNARIGRRAARLLAESLAIYAVYTLLVDVNRQFTPPPAGISPIWLPAGFALGVVLVRGWWTVIPLFLTGFVNTLRTDLALVGPVADGGAGLSHQEVAWAAVLFGLAIVSHCVIAKLIIDRLPRRDELDGVWSSAAFLLVAGPISCAASALLGTQVFHVEGFVTDDAYVVSAFTFWIGDAIACMLVAPVFVAMFGGPSWRTRRLPILALAVATTVIVLASTSLVGRTELARIQQTFERSTGRAVEVFEDRVHKIEATAVDMATLVGAADDLDAATFDTATQAQRSRDVHVPLVASMAAPGGDLDELRVRFVSADDPYAATRFRKSWIADPLLPQLERARDTGAPVWIPRADDPGATEDFVYAPVYDAAGRIGLDGTDADAVAQRRAALIGFVAVQTDLRAALAASTDAIADTSTSALLRDERRPSRSDARTGEPVVLAATPVARDNPLVDSDLAPLAAARTRGVPFASDRTLDVGGSTWSVAFAPSRTFVTDRAFLVTILPASLIALAFTLTIGILALTSTGQRARLARLVRLRTRALRVSEHRYRSVVDNVREAIFQLDEDDRITFVSAAWDTVPATGDHASVVGQPLVSVLRVADHVRLGELLAQAREAPGVTLRGEFESSDHELVLEIRIAAPLAVADDDEDEGHAGDDSDEATREERGGAIDEQGAIVGMIVDMTEQRNVLRNRERFVSLVAHELRNPLTVISGSVLTIDAHEQEQLPPLTAQLLPAVQLSAQKLDRIISDLLVSSQVDAGTLTLHTEPTDLRGVVAAAADAARVGAGDSGIELYDDTGREPILVTCDVDRISQVLDNLLSNAIKYTRSGGSVRISAERVAEHVEVRVADNGIGVAPEDQRRIFERFGRTQEGATVASGTGLGLAICLAIVEAHGGSISVESELGVGSTFVLALPATPPG